MNGLILCLLVLLTRSRHTACFMLYFFICYTFLYVILLYSCYLQFPLLNLSMLSLSGMEGRQSVDRHGYFVAKMRVLSSGQGRLNDQKYAEVLLGTISDGCLTVTRAQQPAVRLLIYSIVLHKLSQRQRQTCLVETVRCLIQCAQSKHVKMPFCIHDSFD